MQFDVYQNKQLKMYILRIYKAVKFATIYITCRHKKLIYFYIAVNTNTDGQISPRMYITLQHQ